MLKRNPRRRAKSSTRSRVAVATDGLPFSAPDTVPTESPSSAASSGIVTRLDGDMVAVYAFADNNPNSQNPRNMPSIWRAVALWHKLGTLYLKRFTMTNRTRLTHRRTAPTSCGSVR